MANNNKNPMEWVTDALEEVVPVATGAEANRNGRIQLLLDRDEVADIYKVRVTLSPDQIISTDLTTETEVVHGFAVSTDPRIDTIFIDQTTGQRSNLEDRNIFFYGFLHMQEEEIGTAANATIVGRIGPSEMVQEINFVEPLTVGGDIGWVAGGIGTGTLVPLEALITVYFKRRKSTSEKANLIMLRR